MKYENHLTLLSLYRIGRGWTLTEMSHFLGHGFSRAILSLLESGRLQPSPYQQTRFRNLFGKDIAEMCRPINAMALFDYIEGCEQVTDDVTGRVFFSRNVKS